jgi:hypothetical protein
VLRFELIELSLLPFDLSLLRLELLLHRRVLPLPGLHLVADQRATHKSHRSTDAGARSGVAGRTADYRA